MHTRLILASVASTALIFGGAAPTLANATPPPPPLGECPTGWTNAGFNGVPPDKLAALDKNENDHWCVKDILEGLPASVKGNGTSQITFGGLVWVVKDDKLPKIVK